MTKFHKQIHDSRVGTGTRIAFIVRHFPVVFRVRVQVAEVTEREGNAFSISSNPRESECRKYRRKHSYTCCSSIPAATLTVLTVLSLPALSAAQDYYGFSPIFSSTSTPVPPPVAASYRASSLGPTGNMTVVPSTLTPFPISPAPIQPISNEPTAAPTLAKNPTLAPTISPAPTLLPTSNPTITPRPTKLPSRSPTDSPSARPSMVPSPAPTFEERSVGTTRLLQSFKVGNGIAFNESETFTFQGIMARYTYNISYGIDFSKVNATCNIVQQTVLIDPKRRAFRRRLRLLQDVATSSNATNQVEYVMEWASYHVNVTEFPSLFTNFIDLHLANVTADLRKGGLNVLSSSSLRAVVSTTAPSATPTISFKPSPSPFKPITIKPTDSQTVDPSIIESDQPSSSPASKPSNQGSPGDANVITNTIVIASILGALAVVSCCGCFVFYNRRKQLRELEFQAAAAAGRLASESDKGEGTPNRLENLAVDTSDPYGYTPRSDDEQGIISPNESLLSNQSLISAGMSLGEGSVDEADRTHNLADAFDQYKDQNLEKVRADVEERVIGSDSMMNQAMTLAFMGDDEIFAETRELITGEGADSTELEADLLCEVNDFLKRNEFADLEERKSFLQETTNKLVAYVLHGVIVPDDASRTIHESAAMLGLELASEIPENTVIVTGLRKNVTTAHLESAFREFGDLDEVAVASDARGFGLVRFLSPQSALRTMSAFREGEIVVQDVGVMVKVLKAETVDRSAIDS